MSDREPPDDDVPPQEGADGGDGGLDPGPPIPELAGLSEPAMPAFQQLVTNRIHRRLLGGYVVSYVWFTPFLVVLEYLRLVCEMVGRVKPSREGREP